MPSVAGETRRVIRRATTRGRALARPVRGARRPAPTVAPTRVGGAPRVGVLGLQGDFALHAAALAAVGCEAVRVSLPEHLAGLEALVLPGGESSTMLRLLDSTGLREPIEAFVRTKPVLGTCAGLILLARRADRLPRPTLGVLDITAERNAWGRQVHSFEDTVETPTLGAEVRGVFIRAPRIRRVGPGVEVFARYQGEPVGVRKGRVAAITFHPELTDDRRLHAWFVREVAGLVPVESR